MIVVLFQILSHSSLLINKRTHRILYFLQIYSHQMKQEQNDFNNQIEEQNYAQPENQSIHEEQQNLKPAHYQHYRSKYMLLRMVLCYNLSSFYLGYTLVYLNAIPFSDIRNLFHIALDQGFSEGLFSGLIQGGAVFGAIGTRYLFKYFTRKQSYLLANAIAFVAGILVLIDDMRSLLIGRFLQGTCVGVFSTITPLVIKQLVPVEISGLFGSFFMPSIVLGSLTAYTIPTILSSNYGPEDYYQITFGLTIITIIIQSVLLLFVYKNQTPKYLLLKNRVEEAKQLIRLIYRQEFWELIFEEKMNALRKLKKRDADSQFNNSANKQNNIQLKKQPMINQDNQKKQNRDSIPINKKEGIQQLDSGKDMLPGFNRPQSEEDFNPNKHQQSIIDQFDLKYMMEVPIARGFAFQLEAFQQFTGAYVIALYGRELAKVSVPEVYTYLPIILNSLRLIASLIGIFLITKFGRRKPMIIGTVIVLISLITFCIGFSEEQEQLQQSMSFLQLLVLLSFIVFTISYSCTMGPITYLYIPQIVQPPTLPFTSCVSWLCACFMIFLFPIVREQEQIAEKDRVASRDGIGLFIFFTVCTSVHLIFILAIMIETKYKDERQIRRNFKEKAKKFFQFFQKKSPVLPNQEINRKKQTIDLQKKMSSKLEQKKEEER